MDSVVAGWLKTKPLAIGLDGSEQVANPRLLSLQVNPLDRRADQRFNSRIEPLTSVGASPSPKLRQSSLVLGIRRR
jgi:hypothetical protein